MQNSQRNRFSTWVKLLSCLTVGLFVNLGSVAFAVTVSSYGNYNYRDLFPEQPTTQHPLAQVIDALKQKRDHEARSLLDEILEKNPKMIAAHELHGMMQANQNDLPGAESTLRKAITLSPKVRAAHLILGKVLFFQGKFEDARRQFLRYADAFPLDITSHIFLGRISAKMGKIDQAIAFLQPLIPAQGKLGTQALLQLILWHLDQGEIEQAKNQLKYCDPYCQTFPSFKLIQSQLLYFEGNLQAAEKTLTHLSQNAGNFPEVWLPLGRIRRELGDIQGAFAAIQQASKFPEHYSSSQFELALTHEADNNPARAIPILESLIKKDPFTGAYELLAQIYMRKGSGDLAKSTLRDLTTKFPNFASGHLLLGELELSRQYNRSAINAFTKAVELDPTLSRGWIYLSYIASISHKMKKARRYLNNGLAASPNDPELYYHLGLQWEHDHQLEKASRSYLTAVKHQPNFAAAINNFALVAIKLNTDLEKAEQMMRSLHANQPDLHLITANLGWVLINRDKVEEGLPLLQKGIEALPDNPELHYFLSEVYRKQGRSADAELEFQLAREHGLPANYGHHHLFPLESAFDKKAHHH